MSLRNKIKKTIDAHPKLVAIHGTNSYTSERPHFSSKIINIIANTIGHKLKENEEDERYSCWCFIIIDGRSFEAKIIHKGRGKFKILNDEYGGKYTNKIVDASDVIRCIIEI
jgi:hypothetical protein